MKSMKKTKTYFVYLLKDGDTVVYVGMTSNLKSRMYQHRKKNHNNVEVIPVKRKIDAMSLERSHLIDHLPKYNWIPNHVKNMADGETGAIRSKPDSAIAFSLTLDFKKHVEKAAKTKKLSTGGFIKAVLKKHTEYVEKDLI